MTQLLDDEMDEVYTFLTPYYTYEGKLVYQRIARKGHSYFEVVYRGMIPHWEPARHPHWCKEIMTLARRIKEDIDAKEDRSDGQAVCEA